MKTVYRIKDPKTGLFVKRNEGYSGWRWQEKGTAWASRGAVKNAIQYTLGEVLERHPDAEVIEYEVVERYSGKYWKLSSEATRPSKK